MGRRYGRSARPAGVGFLSPRPRRKTSFAQKANQPKSAGGSAVSGRFDDLDFKLGYVFPPAAEYRRRERQDFVRRSGGVLGLSALRTTRSSVIPATRFRPQPSRRRERQDTSKVPQESRCATCLRRFFWVQPRKNPKSRPQQVLYRALQRGYPAAFSNSCPTNPQFTTFMNASTYAARPL